MQSHKEQELHQVDVDSERLRCCLYCFREAIQACSMGVHCPSFAYPQPRMDPIADSNGKQMALLGMVHLRQRRMHVTL